MSNRYGGALCPRSTKSVVYFSFQSIVGKTWSRRFHFEKFKKFLDHFDHFFGPQTNFQSFPTLPWYVKSVLISFLMHSIIIRKLNIILKNLIGHLKFKFFTRPVKKSFNVGKNIIQGKWRKFNNLTSVRSNLHRNFV